ncbi:MAG TPA: DUF1634 domain-containing protein [Dehalococcoidia bacterium]|nr:DUF1634 domain-containing protein [Dehalococcoidia bacterium]
MTVESPSPAAAEAPISARTVELWISYVLRAGVLLAAAIILTGVALLLVGRESASAPHSFSALVHTHASPLRLDDVWSRAMRLHPVGLIQLGLFVLILTPVVRVAMTVLLFAIDRDALFLVIVTIVLTVLVLGVTARIG